MMFIDADGVEAQFLGIGQLVEVRIIFGGALFRIVETVGQNYPGRDRAADRA
jgi:hypothetical protein